MRIPFLAFLITFFLNSQVPPNAPPVVVRDPQAVALLQKSVAVMGVLPSDSRASGDITIVAGSLTQLGTIQILTRGTTQTSVAVQAGTANWSVIYSAGQANRIEAGTTSVLSVERSASSQSLHFPLPFIYGLLSNPDSSLQYIGQESLGSSAVNHIRVQNTFASQPLWQSLSEFTMADIWLDVSTELPAKISLVRRDGGGSAPKIPISISYSNYQTVSGVQYPFTIQEFVTGTLWTTTTIQSVSFNTGLTDANFPVMQEGN
ncbi:MAG: hypothetical protein ABSG77_08915 [Candidatus Acidiferrum sp.]|jgi:hypothetical protein